MPLELTYESPKRGAGAPLRSAWIAESDTRTREHLERKGWRVVERREAETKAASPLPTPATSDEIDRLHAELAEIRNTLFEKDEIERLRESLAKARTELSEESLSDKDSAPLEEELQPLTAEALGVTEAQMQALIGAGYSSTDSLRAASDEVLRAIDGIGPAAVRNLRKALAAL